VRCQLSRNNSKSTVVANESPVALTRETHESPEDIELHFKEHRKESGEVSKEYSTNQAEAK
jgi:hypothetical protein